MVDSAGQLLTVAAQLVMVLVTVLETTEVVNLTGVEVVC